MWSDTGDIAEQLADEDPLHTHADSQELLARGPGRARGKKGRKVHYDQQDHPERENTQPGIDKEAIQIPEPAQRKISVFEKILAITMAPGDMQTARTRGLVGKPLL